MSMGALAALIDFTGVAVDEFNDWYDTEHIPERLAVPGFLSAQRWVAADGSALSFAFYDLESVEVLTSEEYQSIAGQDYSPWTRRILSKTRDFARYEAVQLSPGDLISPAKAAALWVVRMNVPEDFQDEFNRWYDEEHLPQLSTVPGVLAGRRFRAVHGPHGYFAMYHVTDPEVPQGEAWREAAETPWTHKVRKQMRDRERLLFLPYGGQ